MVDLLEDLLTTLEIVLLHMCSTPTNFARPVQKYVPIFDIVLSMHLPEHVFVYMSRLARRMPPISLTQLIHGMIPISVLVCVFETPRQARTVGTDA